MILKIIYVPRKKVCFPVIKNWNETSVREMHQRVHGGHSGWCTQIPFTFVIRVVELSVVFFLADTTLFFYSKKNT